MGQITAPILAITLVLLSVFVPVAFIPGISGQLYQQFAVAVAVSMVISAINALTLSPALCAVLLRHHAGPKRGPIRYVLGRSTSPATATAIVKRLVRVAFLSLVVVAASSAEWLAVQGHPGGFLPSEDQGAFFVEAQLPEGPRSTAPPSSPSGSRRSSGYPGVADISTVVGYSTLDGLSKSNSAYFIVLLKPFEERTGAGEDVGSIIARVRAEVRRSARPTSSRSTCRRSSGWAPAAASSTSCSTCRAAIPPTSPASPAADLRRQPEPAARRRVHDLLRQHAAALPRHRPRQGADARDQPRRRVQRAAGDAGRLLRQRSQPVRPHLAAQPAGRGGGPRLDRRHLPDPCPQREWRHGAVAQLRRCAPSSARRRSSATTTTAR